MGLRQGIEEIGRGEHSEGLYKALKSWRCGINQFVQQMMQLAMIRNLIFEYSGHFVVLSSLKHMSLFSYDKDTKYFTRFTKKPIKAGGGQDGLVEHWS